MHARIGWQNLRTSEFLDNGDYMLITGTDFMDGAVNFDTCHYVERERYEQDKHIQIRNGSILITKDGTLGKVAYIQGLTMPATLNAGVFNVEIRDEKEVDNRYLFQYLKAPFLMDYVDKKATGGTIKHLNQNILVDFPVVLPQKDEQAKIGEYFLGIDNLITLHQREFAFLCKEKSKKFRYIKNAWEQRKVREVTDRYDNLRIPVAASLRVAGTTPYYGANGIQDYVDGYTHDGEFILVAEDGANDLKNYPVKCVKGRIWVNNHAHVLQGKYDCADNQFLAYAISQADIESLLVGGGRAKLNAETLMGIDLLLPNKAEQIRIGKYLAQLDNLITLHQRKCISFTGRAGRLISTVNKKRITSSWEQRKLGEIGSVSMCRRIFKEQTSETGDIPFYKIGTFGAEPDAFISRELFEEYKSKYPYPKKGDILISASGSIGRTVEFAGNNEYFQDSNIVWLSHDERLSNSFLKCFYSVVKWAGIEGSTIKRLYNDNILNTVICMPSVPEQEHIGLFFENLDNLITLHQRELEKLQNIKKSMLEKMFV